MNSPIEITSNSLANEAEIGVNLLTTALELFSIADLDEFQNRAMVMAKETNRTIDVGGPACVTNEQIRWLLDRSTK